MLVVELVADSARQEIGNELVGTEAGWPLVNEDNISVGRPLISVDVIRTAMFRSIAISVGSNAHGATLHVFADQDLIHVDEVVEAHARPGLGGSERFLVALGLASKSPPPGRQLGPPFGRRSASLGVPGPGLSALQASAG